MRAELWVGLKERLSEPRRSDGTKLLGALAVATQLRPHPRSFLALGVCINHRTYGIAYRRHLELAPQASLFRVRISVLPRLEVFRAVEAHLWEKGIDATHGILDDPPFRIGLLDDPHCFMEQLQCLGGSAVLVFSLEVPSPRYAKVSAGRSGQYAVDLASFGKPSLSYVQNIIAVLDVHLDRFVASLVIRS